MTGPDDEAIEFGRYRLLRLLGRGGMAEVHLAESVGPMSFRKRVAVKRLLPIYAHNKRYVQMLMDEARIAGAIQHPNVVHVIEFGQVDRQPYLAMEFIDGVDLASVLRGVREAGGRMPLNLALHVARCIADGLHAAHVIVDSDGAPMRVVHRDVSPHNVLLGYDGEVKLIDFGVAKASTNLTQTRSGIIKGKLQYMSPEQAQALPVDPRADVFSLGLTLYKMLTGRLPFRGANEFQIYDQILRKRPTPPSRSRSDVAEGVDALVLKALSKEPEGRFESAWAFARALEQALLAHGDRPSTGRLAAWVEAALPREHPRDPVEDDFTVGDAPFEAESPPADPEWSVEAQERATRVETLHAATAHDAVVDATQRSERSAPHPVTDDGDEAEEAVAAPVPSRVLTAPEPTSVPSVQTSQLEGLRRPTGRHWAVAVGVLLAAGVAGFGLTRSLRNERPGLEAPASVAVGVTPPVSEPSAPPTPAAPSQALAPTSTTPSQAPAPTSTAPTSTEPRAVAPARAWLTVTSLPWAWVYVDGTRLSRHTPVVGTPLKPGKRRVKLETADGRKHEVDVQLRPGQRLTLSHDFK
jgi:serine/threonine-protein kinase